MKITIAERLKPFSHTPGAACLIPGTFLEIEAFPALLRFGKHELSLGIRGPVKDFTLEQDLEKNCVWVFGHAREGFYRLKIQATPSGVEAIAVNAPKGGALRPRERLFFETGTPFFLPPVWERLSLGVSKAQDWDLVLRRFDLREILPVLYGLGQKIPPIPPEPLRGTGRLLEEGNLDSFCRAAFSKILIPRFIDDQHQALAPIEAAAGNPCLLLQEAARHIRALFFRQEGNQLNLLPASPFDAGRMTNLAAAGIGALDLEWASRAMRRAILRASTSTEISIELPKGYRSFRIRASSSERGHRHEASTPLAIKEGKTYFLDRFHKS